MDAYNSINTILMIINIIIQVLSFIFFSLSLSDFLSFFPYLSSLSGPSSLSFPMKAREHEYIHII